MPVLDYIDRRVCPLGSDGRLLTRTPSEAHAAGAAGKRVTVGECWLDSAAPEELAASARLGNVASIQNRDVHSSAIPHDERSMRDIRVLGDATEIELVLSFRTCNLIIHLDSDSRLHDMSSVG
jgi:hypothetical protein